MKIKWLRSGYGKLQRKIFLQILLMIPGAWLLFFLVYGVLGGKIANACVRLIHLFLFVDYEKALFIYQYYIRNHMEMFIEIFFVLSILLFFYLSLGWFLRYFRQIDRGMDDLLAGKEIRMSPEMETMERKMIRSAASWKGGRWRRSLRRSARMRWSCIWPMISALRSPR